MMAVSIQTPTLDNTLGAGFLGIVVSSFVFGVNTLQAYSYYHRFPQDSSLHKCSVCILWLLDAFHLAFCTHGIYVYVVTGFGDFNGLANIVWSFKVQVSLNVVIVLMVQSLYARRVWLLGGYLHGFLGYLVAAVVAGGFGIGTVLAYKIYTLNTYLELDTISWVINACLATSTAIDFVMAGAMCYYLRKSKGMETLLNSRISRLMQYTLGSGLFTSACSLSAMFSYILMPNTFVFIALEFLLTKLYVSSFLAMLNSRQRTRRQNEEEPSVGTPRHLLKTVSFSFRNPSLPSASLPSYSHETIRGEKSYPWQ